MESLNLNIIIKPKSMKRNIFLLGIVVLLATGCGTTGNIGQSGQNTSGQKFTDQSYYQNSYLISGDSLSPDAEKALTGFKMERKPMPDGSTEVSLKAEEPQYHDQKFTLKPGEQLYMIDYMLGDDSGKERNIFDDSAVVVDSQGVVVTPPADWSK
jgi:hypothetical protein